MKILNLYSGIGGNREKWSHEHKITAVEIVPEIAEKYAAKFTADNVVIGNAHDYLLEHFDKFDFIWSSPPCPSHSRARFWNTKAKRIYPDMALYQEIIFLTHHARGKWVIENVIPYYEPLIPAVKVGRHMLWSNFKIGKFEPPKENVLNQPKNSPERNAVLPEIGQYVLNCAQNILTKQNIEQSNLFD